ALCTLRVSSLRLLRAGLPSRSLPSVQIVPVQDRVEAEEERALRLPPPEGTDREHDDVALTERDVHDLSAVRQRLPAREPLGQRHSVRVCGEPQDAARALAGIGSAAAETPAAAAAPAASSTAAAATSALRFLTALPGSRHDGVGIPDRELLLRLSGH